MESHELEQKTFMERHEQKQRTLKQLLCEVRQDSEQETQSCSESQRGNLEYQNMALTAVADNVSRLEHYCQEELGVNWVRISDTKEP